MNWLCVAMLATWMASGPAVAQTNALDWWRCNESAPSTLFLGYLSNTYVFQLTSLKSPRSCEVIVRTNPDKEIVILVVIFKEFQNAAILACENNERRQFSVHAALSQPKPLSIATVPHHSPTHPSPLLPTRSSSSSVPFATPSPTVKPKRRPLPTKLFTMIRSKATENERGGWLTSLHDPSNDFDDLDANILEAIDFESDGQQVGGDEDWVAVKEIPLVNVSVHAVDGRLRDTESGRNAPNRRYQISIYDPFSRLEPSSKHLRITQAFPDPETYFRPYIAQLSSQSPQLHFATRKQPTSTKPTPHKQQDEGFISKQNTFPPLYTFGDEIKSKKVSKKKPPDSFQGGHGMKIITSSLLPVTKTKQKDLRPQVKEEYTPTLYLPHATPVAHHSTQSIHSKPIPMDNAWPKPDTTSNTENLYLLTSPHLMPERKLQLNDRIFSSIQQKLDTPSPTMFSQQNSGMPDLVKVPSQPKALQERLRNFHPVPNKLEASLSFPTKQQKRKVTEQNITTTLSKPMSVKQNLMLNRRAMSSLATSLKQKLVTASVFKEKEHKIKNPTATEAKSTDTTLTTGMEILTATSDHPKATGPTKREKNMKTVSSMSSSRTEATAAESKWNPILKISKGNSPRMDIVRGEQGSHRAIVNSAQDIRSALQRGSTSPATSIGTRLTGATYPQATSRSKETQDIPSSRIGPQKTLKRPKRRFQTIASHGGGVLVSRKAGEDSDEYDSDNDYLWQYKDEGEDNFNDGEYDENLFADRAIFDICDYDSSRTHAEVKALKFIQLINSSKIILRVTNFSIPTLKVIVSAARRLAAGEHCAVWERETVALSNHRVCIAEGDFFSVFYVNTPSPPLPACENTNSRVMCYLTAGAVIVIALLVLSFFTYNYWMQHCMSKVNDAFFIHVEHRDNMLYLDSVMRGPRPSREFAARHLGSSGEGGAGGSGIPQFNPNEPKQPLSKFFKRTFSMFAKCVPESETQSDSKNEKEIVNMDYPHENDTWRPGQAEAAPLKISESMQMTSLSTPPKQPASGSAYVDTALSPPSPHERPDRPPQEQSAMRVGAPAEFSIPPRKITDSVSLIRLRGPSSVGIQADSEAVRKLVDIMLESSNRRTAGSLSPEGKPSPRQPLRRVGGGGARGSDGPVGRYSADAAAAGPSGRRSSRVTAAVAGAVARPSLDPPDDEGKKLRLKNAQISFQEKVTSRTSKSNNEMVHMLSEQEPVPAAAAGRPRREQSEDKGDRLKKGARRMSIRTAKATKTDKK